MVSDISKLLFHCDWVEDSAPQNQGMEGWGGGGLIATVTVRTSANQSVAKIIRILSNSQSIAPLKF